MKNMTRREKLELLESATARLQASGNRPIYLHTDVVTIAGLIGQLQLAFHHPDNVSQTRTMVESLVRDLIDLIDPHKGDVHRFLMMGFEQQYDEPVEAAGEGLDWERAISHFREVRQRYQELISEPGANTSIALEVVFKPLAARFHRGERTAQLFRAMSEVE